jgi:hypothetical protein
VDDGDDTIYCFPQTKGGGRQKRAQRRHVNPYQPGSSQTVSETSTDSDLNEGIVGWPNRAWHSDDESRRSLVSILGKEI